MRILFSVVSFFCLINIDAQSIFNNPITGTNPNTSNPYTTGQSVNSNITASGIGRGSGITGTNANDRYNANSWDTGIFDNTAYFYFTLTPNSGYEIDFVSFVYTGQSSGTGPTSFAFRSSVDNYASNIGTPTATGTTISLSNSSYQNITSPITFRIYGWGASAAAGTFSINDFTFNGTVNACNLADYCNLQFPSTQTICQGSNFTSFGQIYEPGFTEAADSNTAIIAQWGYNTYDPMNPSTNLNPSTWPSGNWSNARWNVQAGNNDEYRRTTGASLAAGTYYYTFRYTINNCNYQYGGYSGIGGGIWNGTTNVSGILTVDPTTVPGAVNGGTSVCPGTNSTLLTLSGHTGSIIKWQSSTDNFVSNFVDIANTTVNYTATNLSITTSYRAFVKSGSCLETPSASTTVTVNPALIPNAGSNTPVCVGNTLNLTSNSGFTNYSWVGPNMFTSSNEDPTITNVTSAANGNYTLTVTGANSCTASQTIAVTINNLPTAVVSGASTICANQTTNLTATGGTNYLWSNGSVSNVINVGIGTYFVTVTDGNGCTDTESFTINQNNTNNNGTSGIYESYVVMNTTGSNVFYDLHNPTVNPDFNGNNLGSFTSGGSAFIKGGQIKTYKNNPVNICGGRIHYSIYPSAGSPGSFPSIGFDFQGNLGGPNQQWGKDTASVNFLSNLTPGTYKIAVYVAASGDGLNPSGCGCDPLHVQNNNGAYWIADFTVAACNPVEVGTISGDNSLCIGESTTLTSDGDSGGTWSSSNMGVATINNSGLVSTVSNGTTTIKYKITGAMGCPSDSALFTLTVNPNPTATITISETSGTINNDGTICNGASVTLTGGGASTYSWNNGITNNTPFNPSSTLTYTLTATDGNGCSDTESTTVTVNSLPTATITVSETSGTVNNDGTICNGASVTLTGGGASTYSWNNGITDNTPFNPTSTLTYTLTATDGNGCSDTESTTVTVNPLPTATIAISETSGTVNNDGTICNGASVTFTGGGASTYSWNNGITDNTPFNPTSTLTYTLTATDVNGCSDTESTTVTVNSLPTATITVTETSGTVNNDGTICNGSSVTLTGGGASTYSWNNGITNNTPFNPSSTLTYTLTATDVNGCSDTESTTITVNSLPTATISVSETSGTINNDGTICNGASVTLTGGGASTYSWNNGITDNTPFNPSSTLTYTLTATDVNGCSDTESTSVVVDTLPNAYILLNNSPSCEGQSAKFTIEGTPNAQIEYSINSGLTQTASLNNSGSTLIEITSVTNNVAFNLTKVKNLISNCEKTLNLSSTVIVNDTSLTSINVTACNFYTWAENNITYTSSEIDTVTYPNISGCDSTIILYLIINNSEHDTTYVTSCTDYFWSVNGMTYSMSGTYEYDSTNVITNCQDSLVLILTVGSSNIYIPGNVDCFTSINNALQDAMPGDTVFVDAGTYFESFEVPLGVFLVINSGSSVTNNGIVCNNGEIILNGGIYINQGLYTGNGEFNGDFVNSSSGEISPGSCGN